jgi:hypothetical protein
MIEPSTRLHGVEELIGEVTTDMVAQAIQAIILWRDTHIDSLLERLKEERVRNVIEQTVRYMDVYGCTEGWLAIFDRRPEMKWDDKIYMRKETVGTKTITIVGL